MDAKTKAIVRDLKRHFAQMYQRGQLDRQLLRLRLTTAELAVRKGRRA